MVNTMLEPVADKPIAVEATPLVSIVGLKAIDEATQYAKRLKDIVDQQKLYTDIKSKRFVHVEGWTTLGAMLGVFPEVVELIRIDEKNPKMISGYLVEMEKGYNKYTKKNETKEVFIRPPFYNKKTMKIIPDEAGNELRTIEEIKYQATVVLVASNGSRIGRAIGICSNMEDGKLLNQEYSIASMAQTRTVGKAFRLPFSWVMTLAGYQSTPLEEVDQAEVKETFSEEVEALPAAEEKKEEKKKDTEKKTSEKKKDPEPVVEEKPPAKIPKTIDPEMFKVPEDETAKKEKWKQLVGIAKEYGISVAEIMNAEGMAPPPKMSMLSKLIPLVAKFIDEKMKSEYVPS